MFLLELRALNAILSKVERSASEETILALIRAKCLQTELCPLLARVIVILLSSRAQ